MPNGPNDKDEPEPEPPEPEPPPDDLPPRHPERLVEGEEPSDLQKDDE